MPNVNGASPPAAAPRRDPSWRAAAPALAAAALGLAWFLANGGGAGLSPLRLGWLLQGDSSQHWFGWAFFRGERWQLPLGALPRFAEPMGTTLGFTDAIPVAALLARPFAPLLPADFQYLGAWLALGFALQGFCGARLGAALGAGPGAQVLTGALFALSPPLLRRLGHESLTAHWILVALLALGLRPGEDAGAIRRARAIATGLCLLAAAVHPALATMALGLAAAVALATAGTGRREGVRAAAWFGLVAAGAAAMFTVLGYGSAPVAARGFGYFSADLLTFVNPMGWSRLLPSWPTRTPGQGDGFAYLGAGGLALTAVALASVLVRREPVAWRRYAPVVAICVLLALVAVSTYVTFAGRKLFGTSSLPAPLAQVVAPFRASGRFIWPLHYLVVAGAVGGVLSLFRERPRMAQLVLAAAIALQAWDLGTGRVRSHFALREVPSLEGWRDAAGSYGHLALFPPHLRDGDGRGCGGELGPREIALGYRAYRLGLGFNSGYLARMDLGRAWSACAAMSAEVARGRLRADTVYVPDPEAVPLLAAAGATCGRLSGETVCVAAGGGGPLRARLAAAPP